MNVPSHPPYPGARVRWQSRFGTRFGRVRDVNEEARTITVQIAGTANLPVFFTLDIDAVTLLSNPAGGGQ